MMREETELCPICMGENILTWDVEKDGYQTTCQHCGRKIMLCDACLHSDDNPQGICNWSEEGCFRTGVPNELLREPREPFTVTFTANVKVRLFAKDAKEAKKKAEEMYGIHTGRKWQSVDNQDITLIEDAKGNVVF